KQVVRALVQAIDVVVEAALLEHEDLLAQRQRLIQFGGRKFGERAPLPVGHASSNPSSTLTTLMPISATAYPPSNTKQVGSPRWARRSPMRRKSALCSAKRDSGSPAKVSTPSDTTSASGA